MTSNQETKDIKYYTNKYDEVLSILKNTACMTYMKNTLFTEVQNTDMIVQRLSYHQTCYFENMNITSTSISLKLLEDSMTSMKMIAMYCLVFLHRHLDKDMNVIMNESRDLFIRKNTDYGSSFEDFSLIGIIVRMNDKINRMKRLHATNEQNVKNESIIDTIEDLYNYSIIALMYNDIQE